MISYQLSLVKFAYSVFVKFKFVLSPWHVAHHSKMAETNDYVQMWVSPIGWNEKPNRKALTLFVSLNLRRTLQGML